MKKILSFVLLALMGEMAYAQFFNSQKGTTLYYKSEDFEEKTPLVTTDTSRIVEVLTVGDTLIVKQVNYGKESELMEGDEVFTFRYTKDGKTRLSLMSAEEGIKVLRQGFMKGWKSADSAKVNRRTEAEMEADFQKYLNHVRCEGDLSLMLDANAAEGDKLPESDFLYKLGPMKLRAFLSNGKVEGFESVTTPAGTFNCLKVSYRAQYKVMLFSEKSYVTEWYAPNVGLVKRQETDKKGNLLYDSVLIRME